jgi:2-methylcitrate dehydratase PrpD
VLALMERITFEPYPEYAEVMTGNAMSRPARIELRARGQTFTGEKRYAKGSPSPDPGTSMTTEELVTKFVCNAEGVILPSQVDRAIELLLNLEAIDDFSNVMRQVSK